MKRPSILVIFLVLFTRNSIFAGALTLAKLSFAATKPKNVIVLNSSTEESSSTPQSTTNNFSRTYRATSILSASSSHGGGYIVDINANEEERKAIVNRFGAVNSFSSIGLLNADLKLRRATLDTASGSTTNESIVVKGIVNTDITRTCVRTGEPFDEQLKFDVFAVLTPAESATLLPTLPEDTSNNKKKGTQQSKKQQRKDKKHAVGRKQIEEMGLKEVQNMLEDLDLEEYVIQDVAIYNSFGIVNVGELIAQLLVLKLDPYPKKPGSQPVRFTFSTNDLLPNKKNQQIL